MRIKNIQIENILSVEYASLSFPNDGLMLVDGWNYDTESANGAGKSSIFTALSWGLFGEYPRGVSITGIVRSGSKKSKVIVEVEIAGGQVLKVERCRPVQNSFFKDDISITEAQFQNLIGITYEQFLLGQYFAQGLGHRFLDLNDSGRKEVILTLMRANKFTAAKTQIDSQIKSSDAKLNQLILNKETALSKISAYQESLADRQQIYANASQLEASIRQHIESVNRLDKPNIDDGKLEQLYNLENMLQNELDSVFTDKGLSKALRQQLIDVESESEPTYSHDYECPHCSTQLDIANSKLIVHDSDSFALKTKYWKEKQNERISSIISKIKNIEIKINKEPALRDAINRCRLKIKEISSEQTAYEDRCRELNLIIQTKTKELETVKKSIEKINDFENKIQLMSKQLSLIDEEYTGLSKHLEILRSISQILSSTGIPAYIMDSVIDAFNDKVQQYLQYIWPNASYTLNTFKENKSGTVTAKMSDILTIDGSVYSIGALSGGERRCLSIAVDFAMLDVISQYTGTILSPIILDEPFDHLDASNRARIIALLKELAKDRLIVVVDHAAESQALFDKVVNVIKRSGTSTIA